MKATRIAALILFLGVSGHAAAQNPYLPHRVITPHMTTHHRINQVQQIHLSPNDMRSIHLITRPCPSGWRLASGSAAGDYSCKRTAAPRCAAGYRVKRGSCLSTGSIHLSTGPQCSYQCIAEKPKFTLKCAKGSLPLVTACQVGCEEPIR